MILDVSIGLLVGLAAGSLLPMAFQLGWSWGCRLLGPVRRSEVNVTIGHVAGLTALRFMIATILGSAAAGAVILGLTLSATTVVQESQRFLNVWIIGFVVGVLLTTLRRRRQPA